MTTTQAINPLTLTLQESLMMELGKRIVDGKPVSCSELWFLDRDVLAGMPFYMAGYASR